jgi:hypothetical protein
MRRLGIAPEISAGLAAKEAACKMLIYTKVQVVRKLEKKALMKEDTLDLSTPPSKNAGIGTRGSLVGHDSKKGCRGSGEDRSDKPAGQFHRPQESINKEGEGH